WALSTRDASHSEGCYDAGHPLTAWRERVQGLLQSMRSLQCMKDQWRTYQRTLIFLSLPFSPFWDVPHFFCVLILNAIDYSLTLPFSMPFVPGSYKSKMY